MTRHQRLEAAPYIDTWRSISQSVIDEAVGQRKKIICIFEGKRTPLWTSAKIEPTLFRATNTVYQRKRVISVSYLIANKVSKSEETNEVDVDIKAAETRCNRHPV